MFNSSIDNNQMQAVARRLVDLDVDRCLHIDDACVELRGQSVLGERKEKG